MGRVSGGEHCAAIGCSNNRLKCPQLSFFSFSERHCKVVYEVTIHDIFNFSFIGSTNCINKAFSLASETLIKAKLFPLSELQSKLSAIAPQTPSSKLTVCPFDMSDLP